MKNLYKEELLDHYRNPRNRGTIENSDIATGEYNPSCGDKVEFFVKVKDNKITEIKFTGVGCVISQAAADMLAEKVKNLTLDEVSKLTKEDILSLIKIELGLNRLVCAMLPLVALQKGISEYKS